MQKLCCVCTRQQFSASLDYFVTSSPPYLHQFSTISGGNCISGDALKHDSLVHIQSEQMMIEGVEQAVMSIFWVTDGVDCCRVGFLPKHFLHHKQAYDGRLAQITQFLVKSDSPGDRGKSH